MDEALNDLGEHIAGKAGDAIVSWSIALGELSIVTYRDDLGAIMKLLRDDSGCQFKVLVDVTAADYPEREERFEIVYNLLSLSHNQRIRVKVSTDENTPNMSHTSRSNQPAALNSATIDGTGVFSSADTFTRMR